MGMKNRIQTAPVITRERNGRRMSPFSLRRTPRLTLVSCHPLRRCSTEPSFRAEVVSDADAHGTGHDAVLEKPGQRLRVQSEPDPAEDVLRPGGLGPVRLRELHVLLRGEVRHLPVPERPREALDESTPLRD